MTDRMCDEVARWLDTHDPGTPPDRLLAHMRECAACAAALARAHALETWLGEVLPAIAPDGFDAAVMARLDAPAPRALRLPAPPWRDPMPAWVRATMEPAVMLALVLAALCVWQGVRLEALAVAAARSLGGALVHPLLPAPGWALALGLLPPMLVASVALYQWSGRLVMRPARPRPRTP